MSDREDFEEAASRLGYSLKMADAWSGEYMNVETDTAWHLWQAAREQGGEAVSCRHFWASHSHTKGMECINCGIEQPDDTYSLSGNYKRDVDSLIRTIEMLKAAHPQPAQQGSVPEVIKQQARRVRNFSNPEEVFDAVPVSAFGSECATPQPEGDGWIKCTDMLPPHGKCVDAWAFITAGHSQGDAERVPDVFFNHETGEWWHWDEGCIEEQVIPGMTFTHWMERPQPPQRSKGDEQNTRSRQN